jgi:hypothetical protein
MGFCELRNFSCRTMVWTRASEATSFSTRPRSRQTHDPFQDAQGTKSNPVVVTSPVARQTLRDPSERPVAPPTQRTTTSSMIENTSGRTRPDAVTTSTTETVGSSSSGEWSCQTLMTAH